ncbi:hypothetical protein JCGZ_19485 [Jatropha curcas]|uniref:Uncharacterized protein n=1 Tax=Jatropha curcas TaxID=180498 RepID=A0A067LJ52_JATCU|nr:uncharacterized protein LOC105649867 [Jatropha curcas]XP_037496963.1 uncharacterized protein LOC119369123 [Jatropha curcas]KDP44670.1 hypothetical protein JCGZ_19485 [Jatropha curcas]
MALSISAYQLNKLSFFFSFKSHHPARLSISNPKISLPVLPISQATRSQTGPLKKRSSASTPSSASTGKKKKKKGKSDAPNHLRDVQIIKADDNIDNDSYSYSNSRSLPYHPNTPLPKAPAGFVVDETGRVLMASNKRIATLVDSSNNYPLECIIRRVFRSSNGNECMLLCPVDTPVQILKSTNIDGWSAVSDEEVEAILPAAAYALAKIHMHLVHSGFCYTARGGFCYSEDDIFDFRTDDGQDVDGLPTEGVEITCFHLDGAHYMIYTPSDPLLFVAVKDQNGQLQIADDDLLEDPAIISAIDEETEFNALVEEEAALLESLMGER